MVWFMLRDDTNIGIGWQSGFLTAARQEEAGVQRLRTSAALSSDR